jgi:hypothetical protein
MRAWQSALVRLAGALPSTTSTWMVVGSAASALQGADVDPADIDLLARADCLDAIAAALAPYAAAKSPTQQPDRFRSTAEQPLIEFGDPRWRFGRWVLDGTLVEVAHIEDDGSAGLNETMGERIWAIAREKSIGHASVLVAPLEVQLATSMARALSERCRVIGTALHQKGTDECLLREALSSRGLAPASAREWLAR